MATAAFSEGNAVFGGFETAMLKGIGIDSVTGSISQMIHVAFRASFACITVALVVGGFAERIRFSAVLIFAIVWFTLSYLPIAHMVWGGGYPPPTAHWTSPAAPWCTSTPPAPGWSVPT